MDDTEKYPRALHLEGSRIQAGIDAPAVPGQVEQRGVAPPATEKGTAEDFTKADTIDSLTEAQLKLIARTQSDLLVYYLRERTVFDAERVRLMLDMGCIEAQRRLDALRASAQ